MTKQQIMIFLVLAFLLWLLLRRRSPAIAATTNVKMTSDEGEELYQQCLYADGTSWMQPVSTGPCPSSYQGFPLVQQTTFPAGRTGGLIFN